MNAALKPEADTRYLIEVDAEQLQALKDAIAAMRLDLPREVLKSRRNATSSRALGELDDAAAWARFATHDAERLERINRAAPAVFAARICP